MAAQHLARLVALCVDDPHCVALTPPPRSLSFSISSWISHVWHRVLIEHVPQHFDP